MTLTAVAKETFNARTLVPVLLAAVAFIVSRMAGQYAMRYHPLLRYGPGIVLLGAGVDLALAGAEHFGLLARLGVS